MHVAPGEGIALRGARGRGKTILLNAIAGTVRPTTGQVLVKQAPADSTCPTFRRRVAAAIGVPPFARDRTLAEHATLIGMTWGMERDDAAEASARILEQLRLTQFADEYPHELSFGETHMASFALVLARPFEVLLLDDPELRLDGERLDIVIETLFELRDAGKTIVCATHSDSIEEEVTDRTIRV